MPTPKLSMLDDIAKPKMISHFICSHSSLSTFIVRIR